MRILFRLILVILVLTVIMAIAYYVEIPYNIRTKGIVMPVREWRIERLSDGTILNSQLNNLTNRITYYSVLEFQRGDHAEFLINEKVFAASRVNPGDTIGYIRSYEEERRLLGLQTALAEQEGLLRRFPFRGKSRKRSMPQGRGWCWPSRNTRPQKRLMARMESLWEQGVIAEEAWELARNDYLTRRQNVNIARSVLEMVSTGVKPEERELIETNIISYKRQIEQTENRIAAFNILAPISGTIIREQRTDPGSEPIIRVACMDSMIVTLPVEFYQLPYIDNGSVVNVRINSRRTVYPARIINIDNTIHYLDRRQNIFVTAVVENNPDRFMPNMLVQAEIVGGTEYPYGDYLNRMFKGGF
jgi:multidrug efflux pump subunit AcrA (membrane-fusion protein)